MRKQGVVRTWHADRGFGFIRGTGDGPDVFFHLRDLQARHGWNPSVGQAVSYEEIHVGGKGPRAVAVLQADAVPRAQPAPRAAQATRGARAARVGSGGAAMALLVLGYVAVLLAGVWAGALPAWVLPAVFVANAVTFWLYWHDKHAATQGRWRTREATLHGWSLVGGWAGAWLAQRVHRHKTRKADFRAAYAGTVVLHLAALGALVWWRTDGMRQLLAFAG